MNLTWVTLEHIQGILFCKNPAMKVIVALALVFSAASALSPTNCPCGRSNRGRIAGGGEAKKNEFPLIGALAFLGGDIPDPFCGATILTPYHALTAAHCTQEDAQQLIDYLGLVVGAHDMRKTNGSAQIVPIEKFINHENYVPLVNDTFYLDDIALVVLKEEIIYNTNVGPACLPTMPLELMGQYVKVMGWGLTQSGGEGSNVLMTADLKIIPYETCAVFFKLNPERKQFCTFGKNRDTCRGDSGGPIVWINPETNRLTLVGVVSFGSKTCGKKPAVSTDVTRYLDWINGAISGSGKPGITCHKIDVNVS